MVTLLNNFFTKSKKNYSNSKIIELQDKIGVFLPQIFKDYLTKFEYSEFTPIVFSFYSKKNDNNSLVECSISEIFAIDNIVSSINTIKNCEEEYIEILDVEKSLYSDYLIPISSTFKPYQGNICVGYQGKYRDKVYILDTNLEYQWENKKPVLLVPIANSVYDLFLTVQNVDDVYLQNISLILKRNICLDGNIIQQVEEKLLYKIPKGYSMILRHFTGELQYGEGKYHKKQPITTLIQGKAIKITRFYTIEDYLSDDDTHLHEAIDIFREKDMMPIAICDNGEMIALGFGLENSNIVSLWTSNYSEQLKEWYTFMGFIDEITK